MAGTDARKAEALTDGPVIILVEPQLGENIGMVARAMLNCGLTQMRLVNPRDGWPNEDAINPASGATIVLDNAAVFNTTEAAIADLNRVYATTARPRGMIKDVVTARAAAAEMRAIIGQGDRCGLLFGRESKGLNNEDVVLADAILQVPLNPAFTSLNLAQAVLLAAYEWYQSGDSSPDSELVLHKTRPADKKDLIGLFEHLEKELVDVGFLYPPDKAPAMIRNLRNLFQRARLTEQEVRSLRGVIACLRNPKG
ncbi:RNA methyltransferase [Magnetospira sp. QH-2]|uniref:RNA methyltransferase n=1 Tax=Magnetospira sp. (strain QH-2) TaxID=1288970 RepID=UPI0003E814D1|nr:RNA methyltransferase [Magnetospira sp. QH-2]CCQ75444.1 putative tRNA/rRNA methyltransferase [Magnetospira sp. QH-2]